MLYCTDFQDTCFVSCHVCGGKFEQQAICDRTQPFNGRRRFKTPAVKKIIKNWLLEIAFQFFVSVFLGCYSSCKKYTNRLRTSDFF